MDDIILRSQGNIRLCLLNICGLLTGYHGNRAAITTNFNLPFNSACIMQHFGVFLVFLPLRLEERVENLEKQNKMKNIRIVGLPEDTPTENLNAKIKDLKRDMGMNPDETMSTVDTVLRLGKPTKNNATKPRHILLTFKSIESRNKFIRSRRNLKGKRKGLAVLEDLTRENAKRYYEARQLYKQEEIVAVWTQGGVVYIKQAEEAKPTTYDDYIKDRRI